jgi:[ribosomal protein S5]-alanine N-acetyltransferase
MILRTENPLLRLRSWQPTDAQSLHENANNFNIWKNLRDYFPYPYTLKDAQHWVRTAGAILQTTNLAIEYQGKAVGGIGVFWKDDVYRKNAEVGMFSKAKMSSGSMPLFLPPTSDRQGYSKKRGFGKKLAWKKVFTKTGNYKTN